MSRLACLIAAGMLPATLSWAVAGAFTPKAPQSSTSTDVACEIRTTRAPGGIELEAVASAQRARSGSYSFDIEKSGSSGDSNIAQAGEFSLDRGAEQILGSARLALARSDSYSADLVLTDSSGEVLCEADKPA